MTDPLRRAAVTPTAADEPPLRPVYSRCIELHGKQTCAEAFTLILDDCRRQIAANRRVVLASADAEAVHQLRVGLTRLRAALKAFRPLLGRVHADRLGGLAQAMARIVGELRDCDVLAGEIVTAARTSEHADQQALDRLCERQALQREQVREKVMAELRGAAWSALSCELALWPGTFGEARDMQRRVKRFAKAALAKKWSRAAKIARHIDSLAPEERHDLRKRLKQLRYGAEFYRTLFDEREVGPFVKRLKRLQDVFGYLNDVELARDLALRVGPAAGEPDAAVDGAAGFILGLHAGRAEAVWSEARQDWHRLARAKRFWM